MASLSTCHLGLWLGWQILLNLVKLKTSIQYNNPDIIFLVETKVDANYASYSFLPPNYEAIRKDRNVHGGGVLIVFSDIIVAEPLQNLNSNCEILWKKIHFARNKCIYFAFYYRPPNDHLQSLEALHDSLTKLYRSQKTPPNVVIAGDFNLPDINWQITRPLITALLASITNY